MFQKEVKEYFKRNILRFCESCNQYKPKDKKPAVKGWKCRDCANKPNKQE